MEQKNREEIEKVLRTKIEERLSQSDESYYALYGFYLKKFFMNVGSDNELVVGLAKRLVDSDKETKRLFVETFFEDDSEFPLRICDTCGNWMIEGYYLAGEYACCDECAIQNYMDTSIYHPSPSREEAERLFMQDLELDEKNCLGEVYWTDWR